jgi:peptidoglycan/xylan/chitin deacetylase (PgdA/CDA1 family)
MYHDIQPASGAGRYSFSLEEFKAHLAAIQESVGRPPSAVDRPESKGFALTFDDGDAGWLAAAEMLLERRWRAFFFVTTCAIGKPGKLTRSDLRSLAAMGHVIGSHSVDHPSRISSKADAYILDQWARSKAELEDILGKEVATASVPGGFYSAKVARAAETAGLLRLFTSEPVARSWDVGRCRVLGRFTLTRGMSGRKVARLAAGSVPERAGQYLAWNLKKAVKAAVLRPYWALTAP